MGASLGALAMLHAHVRHPKSFDGLLLQSGSFFRQRYDKQESRLPALPADHALRRHRPARRRRRADDPGRDHVRHRRGEPREQRALADALHRAGLPGVARARSATATTGPAGATRSTRTCPR